MALGRARRIEAFVGQDAKKEEVQKRIDDAFEAAYADGFFQVTVGLSARGDSAWICVFFCHPI